jgi:hypothetical protein
MRQVNNAASQANNKDRREGNKVSRDSKGNKVSKEGRRTARIPVTRVRRAAMIVEVAAMVTGTIGS